jgi:hypothetical protein
MKNAIRVILWRWTLKRLRLAVDAADEWLHAREVQFREARMVQPETPALVNDEFNVAKSRVRERAIKKAGTPRLRYQHGQFVRQT